MDMDKVRVSSWFGLGIIYYKNGIDLLSKDSLLNKVPGAMPQMMFPNGYITNIGDASYSTMFTSQID